MTEYPIFALMTDQKGLDRLGGTMRLGLCPCVIKKDSLAHELYGCQEIQERHRHRYEFNNAYRTMLEESDLIFSGHSPDQLLVEIIENKAHPS